MKKFIGVLMSLLLIFSLVGCGSGSSVNLKEGQELTLSKNTPVCSSKDNVDKMINYLRENNNSAIEGMESRGEATVLSSGIKVNVVDIGNVTEIETSNGTHWFAPIETFENK